MMGAMQVMGYQVSFWKGWRLRSAMSTQHSPIKSLDTKVQESFPGCQCSIHIVTHFFLGKLDIVESTTGSSVLESLLDPVLCASSLGWLKSASFHYNKSQP